MDFPASLFFLDCTGIYSHYNGITTASDRRLPADIVAANSVAISKRKLEDNWTVILAVVLLRYAHFSSSPQ